MTATVFSSNGVGKPISMRHVEKSKSTFAASFWQPKPLNGATEHDLTTATIALDVIKDGDLVGQEVFPPSNDRYLKGHRRNFTDNGTPIVLRA